MNAEEHSHIFPTWELYPRVHYFRSRYMDFDKRFRRVIKALPTRFYEKAPLTLLDNLNATLSHNLHLMVLGQEDLSISKLTVSPEVLNRYSHIPSTSKEEIHICICYVKEQDIGDKAMKSIDSALTYLSSTLLDRVSSVCAIFIVCDTLTSLQDEDSEIFRKKILELVPKKIGTVNMPVEILTGQKVKDLPSLITNSFEKQIMNGFLEIFSFLQTFIRIDNHSDPENADILSSENVVHAIRDFLRNGHHLIDSKRVTENVSILELVIEILCHRIMCAAVSPMGSKYNIPDWVCHGLLDEISFEKELQKSIAPNTRHHLKKVGDNALELIELMAERKYDEKTNTSKVLNFDFIVHLIKKDLVESVASAEKKLTSMKQLTIIIRKMIFEVKGYLKQTIVEIDIVEIGPRDLETKDISDNLRREIMRTEGVYGMGILYGQLEIHLRTGLEEKATVGARENVTDILKRYRFPYPYTIKTVEKNPQAFARDFYESGEKLLSPFPDDRETIREGTLGCFIKDPDENIHALTCAHVVDSHGNDDHEVFIRSQKCVFAHSSSHLTIKGTDTVMQFADFAAIKVLPENKEKISFRYKDESSNSKQGRIVRAQSDELVGSYVFKYGASTGLTRGIVASNNYILGEKCSHIILVEPLPVGSNNTFADMFNGSSQTPTQESMPSGFNELSQPLTQEDESSKSIESPSLPPSLSSQDMISISASSGFVHKGKSSNIQSPQNNEITSDETFNEQAATSFGDNSIKLLKKSSVCASSNGALLPRPEQHEGQDIRDSEFGGARNSNELLSEALSDINLYDTQAVAAQGDSGAVICRNNLLANEIELISMITAGDFKLNEPSNSGSERKKCLSVSMKLILDKLREHSGKEFKLC